MGSHIDKCNKQQTHEDLIECYHKEFDQKRNYFKENYSYTGEYGNPVYLIQTIICCLSGSMLLLVGTFIWLHPKFKTSHYKLIYLACLAEAIMLNQLSIFTLFEYDWIYYCLSISRSILYLIKGASIEDITTIIHLYDS